MNSNTQLAPPPETTTDRIRRVLAKHGRLSRDAGKLPENADLYALGLSSLAGVNVMLALESEFDVEFPDQMLNRSVFESIAAIADAVRQLTGE
jgi:acyl carrier protein